MGARRGGRAVTYFEGTLGSVQAAAMPNTNPAMPVKNAAHWILGSCSGCITAIANPAIPTAKPTMDV